jgi:chemotaxis protein MotB
LKVTQYKNMLTVDVAEKIFFASGSAQLKDTGKEILKKLAGALKSYPDKYIRVVGHTDNVRVSKATQATFPSNWELSAIRATNVVRTLQEFGVGPERLIISARGEFQPIADNKTPEGRQKNRRIEIMLLGKELVESVQPK